MLVGGLVAGVLTSRLSDLSSGPGQEHCVVFLVKAPHLYSASLHPGVYLRWTSIPSRGSRNTPSRFVLQKLETGADLLGHLARIQTLP